MKITYTYNLSIRKAAIALFLYALFIFYPDSIEGQTIKSDSLTYDLEEIVIEGYLTESNLSESSSSISRIDSTKLKYQHRQSLLPAVNTAPGVRMEQRSPGSYRLSIRGSTLRSPYGIRNVKIYYNKFPLTQAAGNTYLNLIDPKQITHAEIIKGPTGSIYGASTGGIALFNTTDDREGLSASIEAGSYNLMHSNITYTEKSDKNFLSISHSYQTSEGYRDHSAMTREFYQLEDEWKYNEKGEFTFLSFFSNLHYETPGGLTIQQLKENRRLARQPTQSFPGSETQEAGIYNKTIYGGVSHEYNFRNDMRHFVAGFASYGDLKNPFITNYERRYESNIGLRTLMDYDFSLDSIHIRPQVGFEAIRGFSPIQNYDNNKGEIGNIQSHDEITSYKAFGFINFKIDIYNTLFIEFATSLNYFGYSYRTIYPSNQAGSTIRFDPEVLPQLGISYKLSQMFSLHANISKGFSPPTIAEVRASNQQVNTSLRPEYGWNYEVSARYIKNNVVSLDLSLFTFQLQDAIVRQEDSDGNEFFRNTGSTRQNGIELGADITIWEKKDHFFKQIKLNSAATLFNFKFKQYSSDAGNFDGNQLTGAPSERIQSYISILFSQGIRLNISHNYTSEIPLNDANTVYSDAFNVFHIKGSYKLNTEGHLITLKAGVNNITGTEYSLGNDINAFGERYYNPAAGRNFYIGANLHFSSSR